MYKEIGIHLHLTGIKSKFKLSIIQLNSNN